MKFEILEFQSKKILPVISLVKCVPINCPTLEKYLSKDFYFEENEVVEFYKKEENISFKLLNYIDRNKIDFNEKIKDEKEKFINIITCTFWFYNRLYFGKSYIKVNDKKIYKNDKDFYPFILWYSINFYLNKNWNN
ncbi:hypothetical protein ACR34G_00835 [Mycoplasma sp. 480]|uniref:hypothetical protein n=1 Tax=Mycoplasma sp. 480 TaxID=3440155 RepID=UPI003F5186FF